MLGGMVKKGDEAVTRVKEMCACVCVWRGGQEGKGDGESTCVSV